MTNRLSVSLLLLAAVTLTVAIPSTAEARNWTCGSTVQLRGFMSWTDYMHKPQNSIAITTWPGGIGNHWRISGTNEGCRDQGDVIRDFTLTSWQNTTLRASPPSYNANNGRLTPGSVDAGGYPAAYWELRNVSGSVWTLWSRQPAPGYNGGFLHRRQTWSGQRIVLYPHEGIGNHWDISCVAGCR